jgi:ubiquinone/menaquinone biosynthesis C-methylase UbiE
MPGRSDARPHELFPERLPAEIARQDFLVELKAALVQRLRPRIRAEFVAAGGKADDPDGHAAALLQSLPAYRWYSALARTQHELYVDSTAECVERQAVILRDRARAVRDRARLGSLHLDPSVVAPAYQATIDIHCVPGGYNLELMPDDVYAAARYELGITLYTMGQHGALNDSKGHTGVAFLRERFADLQPSAILDLGCTIGNSTLPYVDAFPQAEVSGIDVSAPVLRYAHARSELLRRRVHFRQADATRLPWPRDSFDVVVSHILLHETSRQALAQIFAECHRVLRPGGVMLHIDVPVRRDDPDVFDRAMADWETDNNNEPFWRGLHALDLPRMIGDAGFAADSVFDECFDAGHVAFINRRPWWVLGARKGQA